MKFMDLMPVRRWEKFVILQENLGVEKPTNSAKLHIWRELGQIKENPSLLKCSVPSGLPSLPTGYSHLPMALKIVFLPVEESYCPCIYSLD